jgi:hypothetical protein
MSLTRHRVSSTIYRKYMTRLLFILISTVALAACGKKQPSQLEIYSDELATDQRIILKEGHSILVMPENNRNLMIAVSVSALDGKLSILEVDDMGKSLSVTWEDGESWTTSVMDFRENQDTSIIDDNGDGLPDLLAERTEDSLLRYKLGTPVWIPIEPNQPTK